MINPRHIKANIGGGNLPSFKDHLDAGIIAHGWWQSNTVSPSAGNDHVALLNTSNISPVHKIGLCNVLTGKPSGYYASVTLGSDENIGDPHTRSVTIPGGYANLVILKEATTGRPPVHVDTSGSEVKAYVIYGLLQSAYGTQTGTDVAAAGSENLQMTFVYWDENNTVHMCAGPSGGVKCRYPMIRSNRYRGNQHMVGIQPASAGLFIPEFSQLDDVAGLSPEEGDVWMYTGGVWTRKSPVEKAQVCRRSGSPTTISGGSGWQQMSISNNEFTYGASYDSNADSITLNTGTSDHYLITLKALATAPDGASGDYPTVNIELYDITDNNQVYEAVAERIRRNWCGPKAAGMTWLTAGHEYVVRCTAWDHDAKIELVQLNIVPVNRMFYND